MKKFVTALVVAGTLVSANAFATPAHHSSRRATTHASTTHSSHQGARHSNNARAH